MRTESLTQVLSSAPTRFFEEAARSCGFRQVAGLDEAGRGPLAGPVVAAAVVLPRNYRSTGLNDSKTLSETQRELLYGDITNQAIGWGVGYATEKEIDTTNILEGTKLAFIRALNTLSPRPDYLLLDAIQLPGILIPQRAVVKGDLLSVSIAAASILAKVTRDRLMKEYHARFPQYNFHVHKGYSTPEHLRLLSIHGPCDGHRQSFRPVQEAMTNPMVGK